MRQKFKDNDLLTTGRVFEKHSRGRQKTRWTIKMNERQELTMTEALISFQVREECRTIVYADAVVRETECLLQ